MGMLAFIINVGLFVKAKINLQNAVDAAAFSGAATQARQLTNIAYVNWEMRNTYKEWMFKYYVLGQMALTKGGPENGLTDGNLAGSGNVSFLLRGTPVAGNVSTGGAGFDLYNVPSICVHNNSSTDICPLYALPGIPRFPAIGVAGISEIHESFVNKLVEEKGENCSARTQINFLAALSWAYSSGTREIPGVPLIATNKVGAWPESLELAMRMRNLEMVVNRPPVADMNYNNLSNWSGVGQEIALNERPIKAFMSAFRNLGGGKYKDTLGNAGASADDGFDELAATFKMTEIPPTPYEAAPNSTSGFLIPSTFSYPGDGGGSALQKHYLDLQAVPLNLATMFTTFATSKNQFENTIEAEASCYASKSAMPVPGYILGFVKNPEVLTYYAVKGEARFTGLFFPNTQGSFKLTAYAAAKPFGGRIGPRLFGYTNNDASVVPRTDSNNRSSSYISGIRVVGSMNFQPGMPIPPSSVFWVDETKSLVGGVPVANSGDIISYGIPNLIYDFESDSDLGAQNSGGIGTIQTVREQEMANSSTNENRGLYNRFQMRQLKKALGPSYAGQNMTSQEITKALIVARQVTKYDAANYLIPDFNRATSNKTNAAPTARPDPSAQPPLPIGFQYKLYAPLLGEGLLYKTAPEVGTVVISYMKANEKAIHAYLEALLQVGQKIYSIPSGVGNTTNINAQAAQSIHANAGTSASPSPIPAPLVSADPMDAYAPTCKKDMASKFYHFFTQSNTACGIVPLEKMMIEYIDKKNTASGKFYSTSYYNPLPARTIMTAYYPSPRQGASSDEDAVVLNPIGGSTGGAVYSARRNYYSTKFFPLYKVLTGSNDYDKDVYRESDVAAPSDMQSLNLKNLIKADSTTGLNSSYFKDF